MTVTTPARPTALITGASTGIGYELAKVFAENEHDLVLVARGTTQLEKVAAECEALGKITARVLVKDLAVPGAPMEIYEQLKRDNVRVDVLVNNAGFGTYGPFATIDAAENLELLQVNVMALTHLTRLYLPEMIARGSGRNMNVASTAAFLPGPYMATYYASKAYVLHFSEAIATELAGTGVTITALCPGPVNTQFQKRAGIEASKLFRSGAMDARTVALAGYRGMMRGRRIVIPGGANFLATKSVRLIPRRLAAWIAANLNRAK
jgi:short-subunit dehydrogenase